VRRGTFPSRLAAVLLFAASIFVPWLLIVSPILEAHEARDSAIAHAESRRAQFIERRKDLGQLKAQLAELRRTPVAREMYLPQRTASQATAALIGHAKKVVERHGGLLKSGSVIRGGVKPETDANSVTIRTGMLASPDALLKILYELESGKPTIILDQLEVISKPKPKRRSPPYRKTAAPIWESLVLDVRYNLTAYFRPPGS